MLYSIMNVETTPVLVVVITERREIISQFKPGFNTNLCPSKNKNLQNIPRVRSQRGENTSKSNVGTI